MILVDTSVRIDHLRSPVPALQRLLGATRVLLHPAVLGDLVLGRIGERAAVLSALAALPRPVSATDEEVIALVERRGLAGSGVGWVDAHLLASTHLTPGSALWTRDRRLDAQAARLHLAALLD